jgi:geranylgeranyl pyrophosphate synthase
MSSDNQSPINPFAAQQSLLRERLHFFLASLHPALGADVVLALEEEGKLLAPFQTDNNLSNPALTAGVWSLLTLLVAQCISQDVDPICASSVAVAVECFVRAIDLLDDVIDEDQTPTLQALGMPRTLNVSTALLTMAQQALLSLAEQGIAPLHILLLLNTMQESALIVTTGQQRDVLAEQRPAQDFTLEECIEIASAKAGSMMRLACRLGALCAGADNQLCEQFSELGELLGVSHQLDNDCHDLYYLIQGGNSAVTSINAESTDASVKSDLIRGKKTLPVVLAAKADDALQKISEVSDEEKKENLHAFHEGIITTWGICLLYRERARERLQKIEAQRSIPPELYLLLGISYMTCILLLTVDGLHFFTRDLANSSSLSLTWTRFGFSALIASMFLAVGALIWLYARSRGVALFLFCFSFTMMVTFAVQTGGSSGDPLLSSIGSASAALSLLLFATLLLLFPRNYFSLSSHFYAENNLQLGHRRNYASLLRGYLALVALLGTIATLHEAFYFFLPLKLAEQLNAID